MRVPRSAALAVTLIAASGLWVGRTALRDELRIDFGADWRRACAGFQRYRGTERLAGSRSSLVHFHGLDGRAGTLKLELLASPEAGRANVAIAVDGRPAAEKTFGDVATTVELPVAAGTRDLDVWLSASTLGGEPRGRPLILDGATLVRARDRTAWARLVLPALAGIAVFALFRRSLGDAMACAWGVLAAVGSAAGLGVALDPAASLALRPGLRTRLHVGFAALLAVVAVASAARSRAAAVFGVAACVFALHLWTIHHGLVYDDFLWARPWPLHEVASTFAGSEDPLGVSSTHYRPLPSVSHALDYLVWGFRPEGYRITNLLLLAVNGALALRLLRRLGVAREAAFVGASVLVVHPMSASAIGWISERTDALMLGFSLLALTNLVSPSGVRPLAVLPFALAAVWSKENGIMLPVLGALFVWAAFGAEGLRTRLRTLLSTALVGAAYVAAWLTLFPEKAGSRAGQPMEFRNFDPASLADWLRVVPGLYGPLLLPGDWQSWRDTPLRSEPLFYLTAAALLGPALWLWLSRCDACRAGAARLVVVGLLWAPIVLLPTLGLRRIDIYRVGLVPALGAALVAAGVAAHLAHKARLLLPLLAAALVGFLAPAAIRSAAAWGPRGFYYEAVLGFNSEMPEWIAVLKPEARARFERQLRERAHRDEVDALANAEGR
jgi:hypothetical protein